MLLPRFTLRTILGILTIGAFVFLVAGMAVRGQTWAWGITIGVICAGIIMLVHAAWFGVVWLFAQIPTVQVATPAPPGDDLPIAKPDGEISRAAR